MVDKYVNFVCLVFMKNSIKSSEDFTKELSISL